MPQIDFHPPLATTTTVHLPPLPVLSSSGPQVLLTFRATPIDGLDAQDRIEIWTDGGAAGTWRAVPFEPYGDGVLVAKIVIDVKDGSFGYTYRVAHASGETTWLGDMGGNGKVDLCSTQGDEAVWKGEEWLQLDTNDWTGFGVRVDDRSIPSGVLIPESQSSGLAFAYVHPSTASPSFATYHPTAPSSSTSTAFALLPTSGCTLASTTSSNLLPVAQPSNTTSSSSGPPAAYASYCGLGFSGGEQERTRAFRSLLGLARGSGFEYVPCTTDEKESGDEVHAVGLVCRDESSGTNRLITYVAGETSSARTVTWDLSAADACTSGFALWNHESKHAKMVPASSKPTYRLASEPSKPIVETLDIVHLFELSNDGTTVFLGILGDAQGAPLQWMYEPEKTVVEDLTVDEMVQTPAIGESKPLAYTSDSGDTAESSGITSTLGFTSGGSEADTDTSVTAVDDVDGATLGKAKTREEDVVVVEEQDQQVPGTAELRSVEAGAGEQDAPLVDGQHAETTPDAATSSTESTPKKSILRFFWITLGFLNSLWWRTMSWFRQSTSGKTVQKDVQAGDQVPAVDKEDDEETPLVTEAEGGKNYASTSQQTLIPDITEPNGPASSTKETAASTPAAYETIRVPETRTTVFPAHVSASGVMHDVCLLTSLRDVASFVAEFKHKGDPDASWKMATIVQEDVDANSEMSLIRIPMSGKVEVHVRIRLV